ncbi:MAG: LytTR family transcriptional regulator DNA-binding domain-containing protein [Tannerellaceae bacterium]|jgi:hypothetical protein|nr:LytTR family transcriptional regulator DNA-binding domain-containing protein [Tannerellaceae bacterium]
MMLSHPFTYSRRNLAAGLVLIMLAVGLTGGLFTLYCGLSLFTALADATIFVGLLAVCGTMSWYFFAVMRVWQAQTVYMLLVQAVCTGLCYTVLSLLEMESAGAFARTLPLRIAAGVMYWIILMQAYHILQIKGEKKEEEKEEPLAVKNTPAETAGQLDRISVRDGGRIHIVSLGELLYIQACGDYVTLFTPGGQYIKEQTMKFFDTHLPPATFVRIHRSTIVNTNHIMRVELFGKESYNIRLKNGVSLRASGAGYKLLKERLNL